MEGNYTFLDLDKKYQLPRNIQEKKLETNTNKKYPMLLSLIWFNKPVSEHELFHQ